MEGQACGGGRYIASGRAGAGPKARPEVHTYAGTKLDPQQQLRKRAGCLAADDRLQHGDLDNAALRAGQCGSARSAARGTAPQQTCRGQARGRLQPLRGTGSLHGRKRSHTGPRCCRGPCDQRPAIWFQRSWLPDPEACHRSVAVLPEALGSVAAGRATLSCAARLPPPRSQMVRVWQLRRAAPRHMIRPDLRPATGRGVQSLRPRRIGSDRVTKDATFRPASAASPCPPQREGSVSTAGSMLPTARPEVWCHHAFSLNFYQFCGLADRDFPERRNIRPAQPGTNSTPFIAKRTRSKA